MLGGERSLVANLSAANNYKASLVLPIKILLHASASLCTNLHMRDLTLHMLTA